MQQIASSMEMAVRCARSLSIEVDAWEGRMRSAVEQYQADFEHQKYALQLQIETNPLQFQPSPVLVQLLQSDKRRGITATSAKHEKQKTKNGEYLERKLESEIRQHYELENAQSCAKWKKLHLQSAEAHKSLTQLIESEFQQLCRRLNVLSMPPACHDVDEPAAAQNAAMPSNQFSCAPALLASFSPEDEDEFRLQLASDWVQQERFNIQEAFTNQTKKIQADFQSFLEQLDEEFEVERQKILHQQQQQLEKQFKSNAKRHMLVHTAPVVDPHGASRGSPLLQSLHHHRNSNHTRKTDVSDTQQRLDHLQARVQAMKETAESKRKEGVEWIGRQCAHLFSQLDCKEIEAKLLCLVEKQRRSDTRALLKRISQLAQTLRRCDSEQ